MTDIFSRDWFNDLDSRLRQIGADSDAQSFDEIKEMLACPRIFTPDEFADMCAYVILAGGFSQQTAKKIHTKITNHIHTNGAKFDELILIFANKNKINAICKIWDNRTELCKNFYKYADTESKLNYLAKLPHIGKITANHLARNLGIDIVKYDIWIQRLGVMFSGNHKLTNNINNGKLCPEIKVACDNMFSHLSNETGLPRGYIDVVLWKACQTKLIILNN